MKEVAFNEYLKEAYDSFLPNGTFLTVKGKNELNTMTIGWGSIGIIWRKPIFTVLVRKSRYTHKLIENTDQFTVSFAFNDNMKRELKICGTKSGRDIDKFKECNLKTIPGKKVKTPVIANCDLHYECEIKYKQDMNPDNLNEDIKKTYYNNLNNDYHTLYYGEIVSCYLED